MRALEIGKAWPPLPLLLRLEANYIMQEAA